jgi:hypothetical protein
VRAAVLAADPSGEGYLTSEQLEQGLAAAGLKFTRHQVSPCSPVSALPSAAGHEPAHPKQAALAARLFYYNFKFMVARTCQSTQSSCCGSAKKPQLSRDCRVTISGMPCTFNKQVGCAVCPCRSLACAASWTRSAQAAYAQTSCWQPLALLADRHCCRASESAAGHAAAGSGNQLQPIACVPWGWDEKG